MQKEDCEGYAELVHLGDCDFVEVKGATFAGWDDRTGLTMKSVPWHEEVRDFAQQLAEALGADYAMACEHEHSCSVLLARRDRFFTPFGHWRLALGCVPVMTCCSVEDTDNRILMKLSGHFAQGC